MDVVHREQALDPAAASHRGNQRRHPVVAMNQVRSDLRHDVIDHLPLEHQRDAHRFLRMVAVNLLAVIKNPVLREVDVRIWQDLMVSPQLLLVEAENVPLKHPPVVGQCHVHVRPQLEQGGNQRGRHICKSSSLGRHPLRHIPHPRRKIGDLGGYDQDAGFRWFIFRRHWVHAWAVYSLYWRKS